MEVMEERNNSFTVAKDLRAMNEMKVKGISSDIKEALWTENIRG